MNRYCIKYLHCTFPTLEGLVTSMTSMQMDARRRQFISVQDILGVDTSCAQASSPPFHLLPKLWLKSWITGTSCIEEVEAEKEQKDNAITAKEVVDLTGNDSKSIDISIRSTNGGGRGRVFDSPPSTSMFVCRHREGICPSKLEEFKAVSDMAYATILSTLNNKETEVNLEEKEFTTSSAECEHCISDYLTHFVRNKQILLSYRHIRRELESHGASEDFILSKSWLVSFRKVVDLLTKDVEGDSTESVHTFFSSSLSRLSPLSKAQAKMGNSVNESLYCCHQNLRRNYKRNSVFVSRLAWRAVMDNFPTAIAFAASVNPCDLCAIDECEQKDRRSLLIEERGEQLENPVIKRLVGHLKRSNPSYPPEFDRLEYLLATPNHER